MGLQRWCVQNWEWKLIYEMATSGHITDAQYVKCSHSYVWNTPQPHRQSMEHRSITIGMKLKVLIKCGTSEMMCVGRIESRNLWSWPLYMKYSHSYVRSTPQPHRQSMEHRSMTICIMLKILIIIHRIYNFLHLVLLYNGLQFRTDLVVYRDPTKNSKKYQSTFIKRDLNPLLSAQHTRTPITTPPLLSLLPIIILSLS